MSTVNSFPQMCPFVLYGLSELLSSCLSDQMEQNPKDCFVFLFRKWAKIIGKKKDNEKHLPDGGRVGCSRTTTICSTLSLTEKAAAAVNSQGVLQSLIKLVLSASDSKLQVCSFTLSATPTRPVKCFYIALSAQGPPERQGKAVGECTDSAGVATGFLGG